MVEQILQTRCFSGLHLNPTERACKPCALIRSRIWNSPDPRAAQLAYNEAHATELFEAGLFRAQRQKSEEAIALQLLEQAEARNLLSATAKRAATISLRMARSNNYRAKRIRAEGLLSHDLLNRLHKLQQGKCPCCKKPLGKDFHMDHIVALAKGGSNTDDNIQLLRSRCNLVKSTMDPILFMQVNGFLI